MTLSPRISTTPTRSAGRGLPVLVGNADFAILDGLAHAGELGRVFAFGHVADNLLRHHELAVEGERLHRGIARVARRHQRRLGKPVAGHEQVRGEAIGASCSCRMRHDSAEIISAPTVHTLRHERSTSGSRSARKPMYAERCSMPVLVAEVMVPRCSWIFSIHRNGR